MDKLEGNKPSLASAIEEKTAWAWECYQREQERFLQDPVLRLLLPDLKQAAHQSRTWMRRLKIDQFCRDCGEKEGGSCCGAGLEKHFSPDLLLLNLLLGELLPERREDPNGCFFLSTSGCRLSVRHVLCINYLCSKITDRISPGELSPLRQAEGEEITLLFQAVERLKRLLVEKRGSLNPNREADPVKSL